MQNRSLERNSMPSKYSQQTQPKDIMHTSIEPGVNLMKVNVELDNSRQNQINRLSKRDGESLSNLQDLYSK